MTVDVRRLGATLLIVGWALEPKWGGKHVMTAVRVHGIFLDFRVLDRRNGPLKSLISWVKDIDGGLWVIPLFRRKT